MPKVARHHAPAMRTLLASALAIATASILALVSAAPVTAEASTGVLRCAMPDGSFAYTNAACTSMGGKAVPLPAEVLNRIERERRYESALTGEPLVDTGLLASAAPSGARRPMSSGCAATPEQLARDLQASMAMGDVNRMAESFDWAGMQHASAMQVMARLERLGGQALVDAEYFDATIGIGAVDAAASGVMQVVLDDAGARTVADFDVRRSSGCYFLRYA